MSGRSGEVGTVNLVKKLWMILAMATLLAACGDEKAVHGIDAAVNVLGSVQPSVAFLPDARAMNDEVIKRVRDVPVIVSNDELTAVVSWRADVGANLSDLCSAVSSYVEVISKETKGVLQVDGARWLEPCKTSSKADVVLGGSLELYSACSSAGQASSDRWCVRLSLLRTLEGDALYVSSSYEDAKAFSKK